MRSPYSGRPFTTTTSEIAAVYRMSVSRRCYFHSFTSPATLSSSATWSKWESSLNEVQGLKSEEEKTRARAEALSVITEYRDAGCPEPQPLSPELIREMLDWAACEHVPDDHYAESPRNWT